MQTEKHKWVSHEWTVEEIDEYGDINAVHFLVSLFEALGLRAAVASECASVNVGLLRREGNHLDSETARYYAYLRDNDTLPEVFSSCSDEQDGPRVPQRFHEEVARQTQAA